MVKIKLNKEHIVKLVIYITSAVLSIILLALSYTVLKTQYKEKIFKFDTNKWILFALYLVIVLGNSYQIFFDAFKNLFKLKINEKTLIVIAITAAFIIGEYFEAAMVVILFNFGELIEDIAEYKTNQHLIILKNSSPKRANLFSNNKIVSVLASELKVGDLIQIKPGDAIPVDSTVIKGVSNIDTSYINGESKYFDVGKNAYLRSGAINIDGELICEVKKTTENSTSHQYLNLIKNASKQKSNSENFITKFAKIYTPIVVAAAVLIIVIPIIINKDSWQLWLNAGLSVLLASCPCAFVISTPVAYFATISTLTKSNILIKEEKYIDVLAKSDTVVFDKTGTLTTGELRIDEVKSFDEKYNEQDIIDLIGSIELHSNHVLAKIITSKIRNQKKIDSITTLPGKGLIGKIGNKKIIVGNKRLIDENKIFINNESIQNWTCIYLAIEVKLIGVITFKDQIRTDAKETIAKLKNIGINNFYILSGDNQQSVNYVAQELEIQNAYGDLLPEDKITKFKQIKKNSRNAIFVGDGVNDGPVLKLADVGIAIDQGYDIVKATADVVILANNLVYMTNNINLLYELLHSAKRTFHLVRANTWTIISIKLLSIFVILTLSVLNAYKIIAEQTTIILILGILADVGLTLFTTSLSFSLFKTKSRNIQSKLSR